jgi:quinol monooxygenase YgiN
MFMVRRHTTIPKEEYMAESGSKNSHGSADVVTQLVTMTLNPEYEQEFLDFAAYFAEKVHANEPGTLLYVLTKHPTEPHTYVWVERYRDQAAEQAHSEAPYFSEAISRMQDPTWWAKPGEVMLLTQVVPH